jgi:tRNA (guanine-N7-)-methyltransferase
MGQKKLVRFEAIKQYKNVLQSPENMSGNWHQYFGNKNPIVLELACGKGEYSIGMGRQQPDKNFIGVDIKGNRIYVGAKTALEESMDNVAFLRIAIDNITNYFAPNEVSEIWIVFPDPFLRASKAKKRLTHPRFLHAYQKILKPGAVIHLKTDSKELFEFTLETIAECNCTIHEHIPDIYGQGKNTGWLGIQTFYEKMHLSEGRIIQYVAFSLPDSPIEIPEKKKEKVDDNPSV